MSTYGSKAMNPFSNVVAAQTAGSFSHVANSDEVTSIREACLLPMKDETETGNAGSDKRTARGCAMTWRTDDWPNSCDQLRFMDDEGILPRKSSGK